VIKKNPGGHGTDGAKGMIGTRRRYCARRFPATRSLGAFHVNTTDTSLPLALTDDQLDQIMRCAAPLDPQMRSIFVEHVARALHGKTIGDGEVFRACRQVLREHPLLFVPPIETVRGERAKYA
jgi:hypothetical protein